MGKTFDPVTISFGRFGSTCPKGLNPSEAIAELKFKMVERQI